MRRKILLILFCLTLSFFSLPSYSYGQTQPEAKPAMEWHCLGAIQCIGDPKTTGCSVHNAHRARLTTSADDLPARNENTYILACFTSFTTEQGNICTTGDSQVDLATVGYDGVAQLKKSTATGGFEFQGLFRSDGKTPIRADEIKTNNEGKLTVNGVVVEPLEWQDYTPKTVGRKWFALNLVKPVELETGGAATQKQTTFTFDKASAKCAEIHWDPYGIVFDSQSLEPVYGAKVSLLKKRDNRQFTLVAGDDVVSILNPFYTEEDGAFSFFVPDGTYKLEITAPNFNFPNNPLILNSNYVKFYSDIYRGEDIVQKGKIEHRDIPIDAINTPYTAPVKLMGYFTFLEKGTNILILQGRVSHPLTTINAYAKKPTGENTFTRSKILISGLADKQGRFDLRIDLNNLKPPEFFGDLELIKNSLMNFSTENRSTFVSIEPIFNYIEGYAQDKRGQVLPNTSVGVYFNLATKPIYETKTDEKGFFYIPSEYLPPMAYTLKYMTPTGVSRSLSLSQFLTDNRLYLTNQKASLYTFKDAQGNMLKPQLTSTGPTKMLATKTDGFFNQQQDKTTAKQEQTDGITNQRQVLIITIVLLLLTGVIATVGGLYLYKKKQDKLF